MQSPFLSAQILARDGKSDRTGIPRKGEQTAIGGIGEIRHHPLTAAAGVFADAPSVIGFPLKASIDVVSDHAAARPENHVIEVMLCASCGFEPDQ